MKNIIAIIPARIGSKGVKEKNLLKIGEHSLVERALFTALGCNQIQRVIVSSDSQRIIDLCNRYGFYAPFKRPSKISSDRTGSISVIRHCLDFVEKKDKKIYDTVVLIEPTCPFRLPIHVSESLDIFYKNNSSSVMSVVDVGDNHPIRIKRIKKDGAISDYHEKEPDGLRRQDQENLYIRNGAVYIFSRKVLIKNKLWGDNPYGYVMNNSLYRINIDEQMDFLLAKSFYGEMKKKNELKLIEYLL